MSKKLIRVSAGLEVTAHDFPQGTIRQQNKELCRLIGNGCDCIERVMPRRLYTELGHTREVKAKGSRCVSMLCDESFLLKPAPYNAIASYLYETGRHGAPILGNVLFVGEFYRDGEIEFSGIEPEVFDTLYAQLTQMSGLMSRKGAERRGR